jgi:acetyl esterase/lipase
VIIHGGAWVQGDKTDFNGSGLDTFFTANGCALINMNYRVDQFYKYPVPVEDIGLVLDYVKKNAATWQVNPNRVCLFGRSSGSQLALIYGYSMNTDNRVKVVIDGFGPTDLIDSSIVDGPLGVNVTYLLGPYVSNIQGWRDASPVFHMQGAVPTVIYQGTADNLVFPVQSQVLQDSLLARGVPNMLFYWQGVGHGWDQAGWVQDRDATLAWVKRFL